MRAFVPILFLLAVLWAAAPVDGREQVLAPESAFQFSARMIDSKVITVTYIIADGYYMYRDRFTFKADVETLGTVEFPMSKLKFDSKLKKSVETYQGRINIKIAVDASGPFTLTAISQGCAENGPCFTPMTSTEKLSPRGGGIFAAN